MRFFRRVLGGLTLGVMVGLVGCGGGGSSSSTPPVVVQGPTPDDLAPRIQAATATAASNPACVALGAYYWEIGDGNSRLAGGTVGGTSPTASTVMSIASASKWLYSTYWVQRTGGVLSAQDIVFFNFQSGYTNFSVTGCTGSRTVQGCAALGSNGVQDPATVGFFQYGGGHMQNHAAQDARLGPLDAAGLATEIGAQLGPEIRLAYGQPQLAGGAQMSADEYAKMLRKIINGSLGMKSALGTHPVCVDPATCATAISTPSPRGEQWHYSIGHWVEDDPVVGDGAFSSPGAFGFYPWVDASKNWYGIVAREDLLGAIDSVSCGRLIRRAWVTSTQQ